MRRLYTARQVVGNKGRLLLQPGELAKVHGTGASIKLPHVPGCSPDRVLEDGASTCRVNGGTWRERAEVPLPSTCTPMPTCNPTNRATEPGSHINTGMNRQWQRRTAHPTDPLFVCILSVGERDAALRSVAGLASISLAPADLTTTSALNGATAAFHAADDSASDTDFPPRVCFLPHVPCGHVDDEDQSVASVSAAVAGRGGVLGVHLPVMCLGGEWQQAVDATRAAKARGLKVNLVSTHTPIHARHTSTPHHHRHAQRSTHTHTHNTPHTSNSSICIY